MRSNRPEIRLCLLGGRAAGAEVPPLAVRAFIKLRGVDSGFFDELLGDTDPTQMRTKRTEELVTYLTHLVPW